MEFVNRKIDDIVISIKTGKTPSTKEKLYFDGNIPWITTSDLKGQKVLDYTEKTISELAIIENEAFTFEENTIIISTIGEIGKACIIKKPMACNQQLSGIVVDKNIIYPELLYYWLVKNQELLKFKANKAIISILNNKLLRGIAISFPKELENQRRIIAQLDQIQDVIDLKIKTLEVYDKLIMSLRKEESKARGLGAGQGKIDEIRKFIYAVLLRNNIHSQVHYPPVYSQPYYKNKYGFNNRKCPNAELYYSRCLSLPLHSRLNESDIRAIAKLVIKAISDFNLLTRSETFED